MAASSATAAECLASCTISRNTALGVGIGVPAGLLVIAIVLFGGAMWYVRRPLRPTTRPQPQRAFSDFSVADDAQSELEWVRARERTLTPGTAGPKGMGRTVRQGNELSYIDPNEEYWY